MRLLFASKSDHHNEGNRLPNVLKVKTMKLPVSVTSNELQYCFDHWKICYISVCWRRHESVIILFATNNTVYNAISVKQFLSNKCYTTTSFIFAGSCSMRLLLVSNNKQYIKRHRWPNVVKAKITQLFKRRQVMSYTNPSNIGRHINISVCWRRHESVITLFALNDIFYISSVIRLVTPGIKIIVHL